MMLKNHHLLHTFVQNLMGRMGRSHKSDQQVSIEKLRPSRLDQTRNKNDYLYVNSPIPKLSSREVASLGMFFIHQFIFLMVFSQSYDIYFVVV